MFMFVFYVLLLYICSIGASFYLKKDSKVFKLRSVIGFCTLLGASQIIYYPLQYFQVSSLVVNIVTLLFLFVTFILGILNIKKEDFSFLKSYEFWIFLIIVFVIIKIIPGQEAGDDHFYMGLFMDNADTDKINSIDPRTGFLGSINDYYLYQGYYLLMSFLYKIQKSIIGINVDNIFVVYRTTMSLLAVIFTSIIFTFIKDKFKTRNNNKVFYIVQALSIFLIAVLEWEHIYWGSFMLFQIFVPLIMILFDIYLKDKKYKYLLLIVNFGVLALASSSLFLFCILAFSYFTYELFYKRVKCEDYYLMLVPSFIYVAFLFNLLFILIIIAILWLVINKYKDTINDLVNNYLKYIVVLIPILFIVIGILLGYKFSLETYRVSKITVLYNIVISLYALYLVKKRNINPNIFVFLIVTIFFFNPLVHPFVSHFITSTHIYYRVFYITKSPFLVTIIFLSIYDICKKIKYSKYIKTCYAIGLVLLVIYYGYNFTKDTILLDNYDIKYNYILREDEYSRELGKELSKLKDDSNIFSVYYSPRMYNNKLKSAVIRYPNKEEYENYIMTRVLHTDDNITDMDLGSFRWYLENYHHDYYITFNTGKVEKYNIDRLNIVYKNKMFILMKYD